MMEGVKSSAFGGSLGRRLSRLPDTLRLVLREALLFGAGDGLEPALSTDWPASLPVPSVTGYGIAPKNPFIRSDMDDGYVRQRRRFTSYPSTITVAWHFTRDEFELFSAWFDHAISAGAALFTMPISSGQCAEASLVRFADAEQPWRAEASAGLNWKVSATLEVQPRVTLSRLALAERLNG